MKLSVVIPVYNEGVTVGPLVERVLAVNLDHWGKEVIIVDGGRLLTWITNLLYGSDITDEATGYKVFRTEVLKSLSLESTGFEFCPEVTAKVLRKGIRIYEVPISYTPRSRHKGKKIRWKDGLVAIWTLVKYRFWKEWFDASLSTSDADRRAYRACAAQHTWQARYAQVHSVVDDLWDDATNTQNQALC